MSPPRLAMHMPLIWVMAAQTSERSAAKAGASETESVGGLLSSSTFLLRSASGQVRYAVMQRRGERPERAARGGGMGGGRHHRGPHTLPPSEDVCRGRATHIRIGT